MKLYLNNSQRDIILEMLRASENNATNGKDYELVAAFNHLYSKIKPENASYVLLNREEAETIVEFCDIVRKTLDNALTFINTKSEQSEEAKDEQRQDAQGHLNSIEAVIVQLQDKIRANP